MNRLVDFDLRMFEVNLLKRVRDEGRISLLEPRRQRVINLIYNLLIIIDDVILERVDESKGLIGLLRKIKQFLQLSGRHFLIDLRSILNLTSSTGKSKGGK